MENIIFVQLVKMISFHLFVCVIISCCFLAKADSIQLCEPYGVRLALGQVFKNPESSELLTVRFNTKAECKESYLTYNFTASQIFKENCSSTLLHFSTYKSYVHICIFSQIHIGVRTDYMVYGKGLLSLAIPFERQPIETHVVAAEKTIKIVCIADWGVMNEKPYDPLERAFDSVLKSNLDIDALYISGDIAYNLDSNEGKNYEEFIRMLSQVSSRWPTIFTTGNHERISPDTVKVFNASFENYGNIDTNVTTIHFHSFNFVIYDPFGIIFGGETEDKVLAAFIAELDRVEKQKKPIIVGAHYAGQCSAESFRCNPKTQLLTHFWEAMIDHKTVLYIGAHTHTYQRLYPYYSYDHYLIEESPYTFTKNSNYLIQIIEGVAGNDEQIIEEYDVVEKYTAAYSQNQTGFGILTVSKDNYVFQHFKSNDPLVPFDTLMTKWDLREFQPSYLRIQEG